MLFSAFVSVKYERSTASKFVLQSPLIFFYFLASCSEFRAKRSPRQNLSKNQVWLFVFGVLLTSQKGELLANGKVWWPGLNIQNTRPLQGCRWDASFGSLLKASEQSKMSFMRVSLTGPEECNVLTSSCIGSVMMALCADHTRQAQRVKNTSLNRKNSGHAS